MSALSPMHLSNSRPYEIQRSNNFEIVFEGLSQDIMLNAVSLPFPEISNSPLEISHGNSKVKVAGQAEFSEGEFVVRDAIEADTEGQLWAWRAKVYDPETDKIGFAADYKRNGTAYQYAPDGSIVRTWKLIGCWPTSFNAGEMNNEDNSLKNISMNISYDKAYPVR